MKKLFTQYTLVFGLVLSLAFGLNAQKYGHLNSTQLMSELPAVKTADSELQIYQNQLLKVGEEMVTKLQANYEAYTTEANSGTLSQIQIQEKETLLAQEQQAIQVYQQEVQNKVLAKRQELYDPIFERVRGVIEQFGKENGYTMIFDSGLGAILFEDSEDLTDQIKARL